MSSGLWHGPWIPGFELLQSQEVKPQVLREHHGPRPADRGRQLLRPADAERPGLWSFSGGPEVCETPLQALCHWAYQPCFLLKGQLPSGMLSQQREPMLCKRSPRKHPHPLIAPVSSGNVLRSLAFYFLRANEVKEGGKPNFYHGKLVLVGLFVDVSSHKGCISAGWSLCLLKRTLPHLSFPLLYTSHSPKVPHPHLPSLQQLQH